MGRIDIANLMIAMVYVTIEDLRIFYIDVDKHGKASSEHYKNAMGALEFLNSDLYKKIMPNTPGEKLKERVKEMALSRERVNRRKEYGKRANP